MGRATVSLTGPTGQKPRVAPEVFVDHSALGSARRCRISVRAPQPEHRREDPVIRNAEVEPARVSSPRRGRIADPG